MLLHLVRTPRRARCIASRRRRTPRRRCPPPRGHPRTRQTPPRPSRKPRRRGTRARTRFVITSLVVVTADVGDCQFPISSQSPDQRSSIHTNTIFWFFFWFFWFVGFFGFYYCTSTVVEASTHSKRSARTQRSLHVFFPAMSEWTTDRHRASQSQ